QFHAVPRRGVMAGGDLDAARRVQVAHRQADGRRRRHAQVVDLAAAGGQAGEDCLTEDVAGGPAVAAGDGGAAVDVNGQGLGERQGDLRRQAVADDAANTRDADDQFAHACCLPVRRTVGVVVATGGRRGGRLLKDGAGKGGVGRIVASQCCHLRLEALERGRLASVELSSLVQLPKGIHRLKQVSAYFNVPPARFSELGSVQPEYFDGCSTDGTVPGRIRDLLPKADVFRRIACSGVEQQRLLTSNVGAVMTGAARDAAQREKVPLESLVAKLATEVEVLPAIREPVIARRLLRPPLHLFHPSLGAIVFHVAVADVRHL